MKRMLNENYDDDKLQALFAEEDEIQRLVDISNRQIMKKRQKDVKKKATLDTTKNAVKPREIPGDVEENKPTKKDKQPKKEKEKKVKEEKTLNASGVRRVIILFIVLILVLVGFYFKDEVIAGASKIYSFVSEKIAEVSGKISDNSSNNNNSNNSGNTQNNTVNVDGYMSGAEDKAYTLKEVLDTANNANTALQNYYKTLVEIANESKTNSVAEKIAESASMVANDKSALQTYEKAFSAYPNGLTYYNSLITRFDHLENLIEQITWVSEDKIYPYINQAINEENNMIIQGKADLINFLQQNNVNYTVNENSVTYELSN